MEQSPKLFSNSILRTLTAIHLGVLLLGLLGFFLFLQYSNKQYVRSQVLSIKQGIHPILTAQQDKWRAWHVLGLGEVLRQELRQFQTQHPDVHLWVAPASDLVEQDELLVYPTHPRKGEPALYAQIKTKGLLSQKQLLGFTTAAAVLLVTLFVVSMLLSAYILKMHIQTPLRLVQERVAAKGHEGTFNVKDIPASGEVRELLDLIGTLHERTKANETLSAIGEIAQQVAHDIRSPLCALNLAVSSAETLPSAQRNLIQSAANRIHDIANDLAVRKVIPSNPAVPYPVAPEPEHLLALLKEILSQKRMEFSEWPGIKLQETGLSEIAAIFVRVRPGSFKSMLSNLLNNAREALGDAGVIDFEASLVENGKVRLCIRDNGKGIPEEVLPKLSTRGFSYGKPDGSGLGLYHASEAAKLFQGSLQITSQVGKGSAVSVDIPVSESPAWFARSIPLPKSGCVVVCDDDPSIHELWKFKIPAYLKTVHLHSTQELRSWVHNQAPHSSAITFLVDQEFRGESRTGIDAIAELGIENSAYLVTHRSDDPVLLKNCAKRGIRVFPKCAMEYLFA